MNSAWSSKKGNQTCSWNLFCRSLGKLEAMMRVNDFLLFVQPAPITEITDLMTIPTPTHFHIDPVVSTGQISIGICGTFFFYDKPETCLVCPIPFSVVSTWAVIRVVLGSADFDRKTYQRQWLGVPVTLIAPQKSLHFTWAFYLFYIFILLLAFIKMENSSFKKN